MGSRSSRCAGGGPSGVQAAALLDVKRDYFRMRPHLGRLYLSVRDPRPFLDALRTLGFQLLEEPIEVGGETFHLAGRDFGADSFDGGSTASPRPSSARAISHSSTTATAASISVAHASSCRRSTSEY